MGTTGNYNEYADRTTLKESADGSSLIFLYNNRSLVFASQTLELLHNFNKTVFDILGSTVLLQNGYQNYFLGELSKIDEMPEPLSLRTKISRVDLEGSI